MRGRDERASDSMCVVHMRGIAQVRSQLGLHAGMSCPCPQGDTVPGLLLRGENRGIGFAAMCVPMTGTMVPSPVPVWSPP